MIKRCTGTLVALCIYSISGLNAQNITVKNDCFRTDFSEDGVSVFQVDRDSVNLIADNQMWGDILIRYRVNHVSGQSLRTSVYSPYARTQEKGQVLAYRDFLSAVGMVYSV